MDYTLLMNFGLVIVSGIAFRVFLPDYYSRQASSRNRLYVQELTGYAGAVVFFFMARSSGESTAWLAAVTMLAMGASASANRAKTA